MMIKVCRKCKILKLHSDFGKHKGRPFNLADYCKICRNKAMILSRHQITQKQKDEMLIAQDSKCAICNLHESELSQILAIDHCHKTGIIRGLLCSKCNIGIGQFNDSIAILLSAIKYLTNALNAQNKGE